MAGVVGRCSGREEDEGRLRLIYDLLVIEGRLGQIGVEGQAVWLTGRLREGVWEGLLLHEVAEEVDESMDESMSRQSFLLVDFTCRLFAMVSSILWE